MNTELLKKNFKPLMMAGVFLLSYIPVFMVMWDKWWARDSYYSHGILIPFVTAYLIWQKKDILGTLPAQRASVGWILFLSGLFLYFISAVLRVNFSAGFSMLLVLYGIVLNFYGIPVTKKILFPLFFLVFMVPLPSVAIVNISFQLKLFAASIATQILNNTGLRAEQHGSIILMQHAQVIVDDVCSGLRSLISLTALGSIFAYWLDGPLWKKIILFLTTIPIAVVTNVCRVIVLASISEIWGSEYASGFVHDATGFMVFVLAFILLLAAGKLIE
jgi:exosortase